MLSFLIFDISCYQNPGHHTLEHVHSQPDTSIKTLQLPYITQHTRPRSTQTTLSFINTHARFYYSILNLQLHTSRSSYSATHTEAFHSTNTWFFFSIMIDLYTTAYRKCAWSLNDFLAHCDFSYICGNLPAVLTVERDWHWIVSNQREMYFRLKNNCNTGALLRLLIYHLPLGPVSAFLRTSRVTTYLLFFYIQLTPY